MKTRIQDCLLTALLGVVFTAELAAQPTAFTYQGRLTDNGNPINGFFDITFSLWNAASGPSQVGGTWTNSATPVSNGLFTATVDFGSSAFTGLEFWLQLGVRTNGVGDFSILSPRQQITATPYAIKAANAMTVDMGSISNPSFIGTTTATPLELYVNNQLGLRIEPMNNGATAIIGGSVSNRIDGTSVQSVIAGGGGVGSTANTIGAYCEFSAIGGGVANQISFLASGATIAGGTFNRVDAESQGASIGGGNSNRIGTNSTYSVIGGGEGNSIANNAPDAVVPGGSFNAVGSGASHAMAAGYRAKANHPDTFVWADGADADFSSSANNQFLIRASGGVGIATPSPGKALQVGGPVNTEGMIRLGSTAAIGGASRTWDIGVPKDDVSSSGKYYSFVIDDTGLGADPEFLVQWGTGHVGIGVTNPVYQLQLSVDSAGKPNGGSWANSSDARLKKNIQPLEGALDNLTRLRGVTFEWVHPEDHANQRGPQGGFIAQEVAKVFPNWVTEVQAAEHDRALTDDGKIKSLTLPFEFDALVVEAIKEQQAQIQARDKEIAVLKEGYQAMERRLASLEKLLTPLYTAKGDEQ